MSDQPRVLTGDRPTGPLHLGHLLTSLRNRVAVQDSHACFNIVADLHTLTTRPQADQIGQLPRRVRDLVLDLLGAGIDPEKTVIYLQSGVPAVYDLAILLQMLTPMQRLRELDTIQEMARVAEVDQAEFSLGLMGYPVLQAADILMARATVVPVGGENLAHVQIARELAERFNGLYGEVFPLPEARSDRVIALPALDGSSRPKTPDDAIALKDDADTVRAKVDRLEGDTLRAFVRAVVEGDDGEKLAKAHEGGEDSATVRGTLVEAIDALLQPIRARRASFESDEGLVDEILVDGTLRAREVAYTTLQAARDAMGLESLWQGLVDTTQARAEARKKPY